MHTASQGTVAPLASEGESNSLIHLVSLIQARNRGVFEYARDVVTNYKNFRWIKPTSRRTSVRLVTSDLALVTYYARFPSRYNPGEYVQGYRLSFLARLPRTGKVVVIGPYRNISDTPYNLDEYSIDDVRRIIAQMIGATHPIYYPYELDDIRESISIWVDDDLLINIHEVYSSIGFMVSKIISDRFREAIKNMSDKVMSELYQARGLKKVIRRKLEALGADTSIIDNLNFKRKSDRLAAVSVTAELYAWLVLAAEEGILDAVQDRIQLRRIEVTPIHTGLRVVYNGFTPENVVPGPIEVWDTSGRLLTVFMIPRPAHITFSKPWY